MYADLVVKGTIHTTDTSNPQAEAFAVKGKQICYVGDASGAAVYTGPATTVLELPPSACAVAGMTEGHAHISSAISFTHGVNLHGLSTPDEYLQAITEYYKAHPGVSAITGRGYINGVFDSAGPCAALLDTVTTEIPILMTGEDGHSSWVNSKALELAGITAETPEVPGGVIVRSAVSRVPTGWLKELASNLVLPLYPLYTTEECKEAILFFQQLALSNGITNAFEPMFDIRKDYDLRLAAYEELYHENRLLLTMRIAYTIEPDEDADAVLAKALSYKSRLSYDRLALDTIKIFIDGVVEGHTAYLAQPYADAPDDRGESLWEIEHLRNLFVKVLSYGFKLHIHAIGDAALQDALDALEYAQKATGNTQLHHAITHLQVVQPAQIRRMRDMNIAAVVNPYWHFRDEAYYQNLEIPFLGKERADAQYPVASFVQQGVTTSQASDWPVSVPAATFQSFHLMVNRIAPAAADAIALNETQCVPAATALQILTQGGAAQLDLQASRGSIRTGNSADFVILDKDPLTVTPSQLYTTKVVRTYIEGVCVWSQEA
ncbi:MAG: amidohydrolase [Lachnospiraceae bacterium]